MKPREPQFRVMEIHRNEHKIAIAIAIKISMDRARLDIGCRCHDASRSKA